ncbi:hypothetical protein OH809_11330 [Streptomyces sp. NBC_00873]|uniref:hypothetical protein n=1 Tax=unclassified Streptomyces TaxID=2593676 RepID=UPI00386B30AF|nr:hypothetical protein OH809_11330 [Streptomyces sp. NBC_00873]WTA46760.1 hypothetical protein OH821_32475 [Streptomyces sp. NBC_00842]
MVGDGTNDAPGPRPRQHGHQHGRTLLALETADIALAGNDLCQAAAAVELSRHTLRVVRQNYGLAIGVNLVGLVAGAGAMNPVLAALLHNTSSIAVVGNSARLVNHTPSSAPHDRRATEGGPSGRPPGSVHLPPYERAPRRPWWLPAHCRP